MADQADALTRASERPLQGHSFLIHNFFIFFSTWNLPRMESVMPGPSFTPTASSHPLLLVSHVAVLMHMSYSQLFSISTALRIPSAVSVRCCALPPDDRSITSHPAAFQGPQAVAQIPFINGQGFDQVLMTTHDHATAPLVVGKQPAHDPLLKT